MLKSDSNESRTRSLNAWTRYFKDLTRRTAFDNILRDKEINIVKNPK